MKYPKVYHEAIHHLIAFGGHNGDRMHGRYLIAKALVALRHEYERKVAQSERKGMLFIAGHFPIKNQKV